MLHDWPILRDVLAVPVLLLCVLVAERRLKIPNLKEMPVSDHSACIYVAKHPFISSRKLLECQNYERKCSFLL